MLNMYFKELAMDINRNHYEEYFLLYLDRELTPDEMQEVERFLRENADLKKEFDLLHDTILSPEQVIFEPKEMLYREEEKKRVVPFYFLRIAAAITLILAGGLMIRTILNNSVAIHPTASNKKFAARDTNEKRISENKINPIQKKMSKTVYLSGAAKGKKPAGEVEPVIPHTETTNDQQLDEAATLLPKSNTSLALQTTNESRDATQLLTGGNDVKPAALTVVAIPAGPFRKS